ncbi:MAG TPA: hypothetical protein VGH77_09245 [Streptosporangiaceae bacterium]
MTRIHIIRRVARSLAGLAATVVAITAGAPAAFAYPIPPHGGPTGPVRTPPQAHTIVVGGMPGWQITVIAVGAAILAAILAVAIDRVHAAHRQFTTPGA